MLEVNSYSKSWGSGWYPICLWYSSILESLEGNKLALTGRAADRCPLYADTCGVSPIYWTSPGHHCLPPTYPTPALARAPKGLFWAQTLKLKWCLRVLKLKHLSCGCFVWEQEKKQTWRMKLNNVVFMLIELDCPKNSACWNIIYRYGNEVKEKKIKIVSKRCMNK